MDMKDKELTEHNAVHRRLLREHEDLKKQHAQHGRLGGRGGGSNTRQDADT